MRSHPRIRKTVKWGGAVVSVVLLVAWVVSGCEEVGWLTPGGRAVGISTGELMYAESGTVTFAKVNPGWVGGSKPWQLYWWVYLGKGPNHLLVGVPLWMVALPTIILSATAWRLDTLARRRAMVHLCQACRYDRTGLAPGAICPECGAAAPSSIPFAPSGSPSPPSR